MFFPLLLLTLLTCLSSRVVIQQNSRSCKSRLKKAGLYQADLASCRPISNLDTNSTVYQHLFLARLLQHVSQSFCRLWSAYGQNHSTETTLMKIANDMFEAVEKGQYGELQVIIGHLVITKSVVIYRCIDKIGHLLLLLLLMLLMLLACYFCCFYCYCYFCFLRCCYYCCCCCCWWWLWILLSSHGPHVDGLSNRICQAADTLKYSCFAIVSCLCPPRRFLSVCELNWVPLIVTRVG